MRILLTGAAGFIGLHVRGTLTEAGHEVVALDALLEAVHGDDPAEPEGIVRADIRDPDALEPLLRGIDVVVHLAAAIPPGSSATGSGSSMGVQGPPAMSRSHNGSGPHTGGTIAVRPGGPNVQRAPMFAAHNDFGTAVLLAAMERSGIRRLILASSVSVYGEGRYRGLRSGPFFPGVRRRADLDRGMFDHRAPRSGEVLTWEPVGEDAPLRPRTGYAASKAAQENYAMAWGAATGAGVTVLRYHHVYGDPMHENAALTAHSGVAARFRAELAAGRAPYVFEDGGQVRDFVHVRDVAAATAAVVARPLSGFVPLNIASGHPITLWEVASIMSRACGGPDPVVSGQYRITDARHIVADPHRARRTVDFAAAIAPAQGLADYAATCVRS